MKRSSRHGHGPRAGDREPGSYATTARGTAGGPPALVDAASGDGTSVQDSADALGTQQLTSPMTPVSVWTLDNGASASCSPR